MPKFKVGSEVEWAWGKGHARARVKQIFTESISREIKGHKITRHGTPTEPAYLLEQDNGNEVLKSESELHDGERKHGWA